MKNSFLEKRLEIFRRHRGKWEGAAAAQEMTQLTDELITRTFSDQFGDQNSGVAVFALGGYGRCELNLHSDVDLLIVTENSSAAFQRSLQKIIQSFWDLGLEVGHQVQSIEQTIELALQEWTFRTTLLEMRTLWADLNLVAEVQKNLQSRVIFKDYKSFLKTILAETETRHQKYGNSPQLLEPNLKNGMGGLRDFHTLLWLYHSHPDFSRKFEIHRTARSATLHLLENFFHQAFLLEGDHFALKHAFEFFMTLRNELHFLTGQKTDRLEYGLQKKITSTLGYEDVPEILAVEQFLREYYLHARKIYHTYQILSELFIPKMTYLQKVEAGSSQETLAPAISRIGNSIVFSGVSTRNFSDQPELLMKIFFWKQKYDLKLGEFLRSLLYHQAQNLNEDFQRNQEVIRVFLQIMQNPERLGDVLRTMHELEILDRFLPEFSAITALAQHDLYHYYSADEHTLLAIQNVADLMNREKDPFELKSTLEKLPQKEILFLALLFHDVGKALPGSHIETGVVLAREVFERWKFSGEAAERVLFLIENHLKMEQFAFRRNSEDPSTLQQFAKIVQNVQNLELLYLLTYGDLSALNPTIWSEWKAIQLWELFRNTKRYLTGKSFSAPLSEKELIRLSEEVLAFLSPDMNQNTVLKHLKLLEEDYLKTFESREIARHLGLIADLQQRTASFDFRDLRTHWDVTIVTLDKPHLLAEICGVLAANDLSIFSAQIFTRRDGVVIDRFRVLPFSSNIQFSEIVQKDILQDLIRVLSGKEDLGRLLAQHKRRWKRRKFKESGRPDEIVFDNQLSPDFTIIDIFTDDAPGLLYQIADTLSKSGVDIRSAKISTRVDQASDSFYVVDDQGQKILDKTRQIKIKESVLQSLRRRL